MLTSEDCLAFCALSEEEIDAIAEHEHLGETVALELGSYLIEGPLVASMRGAHPS